MTERRNAWAHSRCVARQRNLQARIDAALAICEQHITFGPVPSPAANVCRQLRAALVGDQPPAEEPTPEDFHKALTDVTERANRSLDMGNLDRQMQGRPPLPLFPDVPPLSGSHPCPVRLFVLSRKPTTRQVMPRDHPRCHRRRSPTPVP